MTRYTTIIPRVRTRAWYGELPVNTPTHRVVPVEEALETEFRGEALMTPYAPTDGSDEFPRLAKAALSFWTCRPDEPMPTVGVVPVDIDYDNHEVPPDDWHLDIIEAIDAPHGWYRTPHGLRLLFYPREPVRLDLANDYIDRLHQRLDAWGIRTDPATRGWYRIQMLPKVLGRDELPSDYSELAPMEWHPADLRPSDPESIGPVVDRSQPDEVTRSLTKTYLKPIGNKRLIEDLYAGRLSAPKGKRHDTILRTAYTIVDAFDTEDPLVPYEILYESTRQMDKPLDELWRICQWVCAQHSGAKEEREETRESLAQVSAENMDTTPARVYERLVVDTGQERFIWDEDRQEYSTGYTQTNQLLGALSRHAPRLARPAVTGNWSTPQILKHYSVVADEVVYTYGDEPSGYDASSYKFYQPVCQPDKRLKPTYDPEVAEWLELLFGDHIEDGLDWLASVPDRTRPTCGLYLSGPPSVGKQLLALGIARIWSLESRITPYEELLSDFNSGLQFSPLIHADEKVPQDAFKDNDSSVFRRMIGNTSIRLNAKYRTPAVLDGYPIVLITSNNADALGIREDLDQHDIQAIRLRLGYIEADEAAADYLESLGGREYTEAWVKGGGLAEHILYLAEHRDVTPGKRLVVEGWESDLTSSIASRVGSAGVIGEAIAYAITRQKESNAIRWYGGHVYVHAQEMLADWSTFLQREDRAPSSNSALKALRSLSNGTQSRLTTRYGKERRLRWWKIDANVIADIADRRGVADPEDILDATNRPEEPDESHVIFGNAETKEEKRA